MIWNVSKALSSDSSSLKLRFELELLQKGERKRDSSMLSCDPGRVLLEPALKNAPVL